MFTGPFPVRLNPRADRRSHDLSGLQHLGLGVSKINYARQGNSVVAGWGVSLALNSKVQ